MPTGPKSAQRSKDNGKGQKTKDPDADMYHIYLDGVGQHGHRLGHVVLEHGGAVGHHLPVDALGEVSPHRRDRRLAPLQHRVHVSQRAARSTARAQASKKKKESQNRRTVCRQRLSSVYS